MLAIQPTAAIVAVAVLFAVHQYVAGSMPIDRWADSGRSRSFQRVREDLHAMSRKLDHPRYWRPVILTFETDRERREQVGSTARRVLEENRGALERSISLVLGVLDGAPSRRGAA